MTESGTPEPGQPGEEDRAEQSLVEVQREGAGIDLEMVCRVSGTPPPPPPPPKKSGKVSTTINVSFEMSVEPLPDDETDEQHPMPGPR
jgi:hypothetical protein